MLASVTVLFGVLATLAGLTDAAPLPMPALKHSGGLAARAPGHHNPEPVWLDGTPCWHGGRFGYLKDRHCGLIDADVGLNQRHGGIPFIDGTPCWNDDKFGSIKGTDCLTADLVVSKRSFAPYPYGQTVWLDGTPCWSTNKFGYLKDRTCSPTDIDLDISLLGLTDRGREYYYAHHHPYFVDGTPCWVDQQFGYIKDATCGILSAKSSSGLLGLGLLKRDAFTYDAAGNPLFVNGAPCYDNGRFGFFRDSLCILADVDIDLVRKDVGGTDVAGEKRLVDSAGLVGGLLNPPAYHFVNEHPNNMPPPKPLLGLAGLKRNGGSHHPQDGDAHHTHNDSPHHPQKGHGGRAGHLGPKSVNDLIDHSTVKRHILNRAGYFDDDELLAYVDEAVKHDKRGGLGGLGDVAGLSSLGKTGSLNSLGKTGSLGGLGGLGLRKRAGTGLDGLSGLTGGHKGGRQGGHGHGHKGGSLDDVTGLLG